MKRYATACFLLATALLSASCLQQQQKTHRDEAANKEAAPPKALPPLHLGAVHQVYPSQGFALLRIIGPMPAPGTTLITHPANGSTERIGNLCISAQQPSRDGIVAADIRSGTLLKGDRVFRYRNITSGSQGDVIAAERPSAAEPESVAPTGADKEVSTGGDMDMESFVNAPALEDDMPDGDEAPTSNSVDTSVLPTTVPAAPGSDPGAPSAPTRAPEYLDSIPDSIDDWDSL